MSVLDESEEKQEQYWQDRSERVILAAEKTADEITADLERTYRETQKAIQEKIESFYGRYSREVGVSLEEARRALNKTELKSYLEQTQLYYDTIRETGLAFDSAYKQKLHRQLSLKSAVSRLEALLADVQWQIEKLYAQQQSAFKAGLSSTYEDSYYHSLFNIQQGVGFGSPFSILNSRIIEKAVSQKWLGGNYSDSIWADKDRLTRALGQIIPRGIALGQHPRIIGKEIADQMDVRQSYGERLARTEFNHIANNAAFAAYKAMGVTHYKWVSALDLKVCERCAEMDGKIFELSEGIEGVTLPPLHPNDRCCHHAHFPPDEIDAMFEESTRIAKGPDGKTYKVPASMTYREWYNQYVLHAHENADIFKAQHLEDLPVTQKAIDRVKNVQVDELGEKASNMLQQEHKDLLMLVKEQPPSIEVGKTFSLDMKPLETIIGESGSVRIPDQKVPYLAMHNHPDGGSFSHDDIRLFISRDNLKIMTVAANDGDVYILSKTSNFDAVEMLSGYNDLMTDVNALINDSDLFGYVNRLETFLRGAGTYGAKYNT